MNGSLERLISRAAALILATALATGSLGAQDASAPIAFAEKESVVAKVGALLIQRYVYPEAASAMAGHLNARMAEGGFDSGTMPEEFATLLTETLQHSSGDKHIRVRVRRPERVEVERVDPVQAQADRLASSRRANFGFRRVEILEGNIGYVDMRSFDGHVEAKPTAAAAMNFVGNADAVIFDMRNNGGGSPDMVRYVSSWFFSAATHLNSLYVRDGDQTIEFWTLEEIPGEKRPDVPLFVLTSERTFSGAEEFTYNMLTQGRATVIGEVSGGGANPGGTVWIDDQFEIFIPQGAAINPITGTNWEGVGVTPDVQATAEQALDVAIGMARTAIQGSRGNNVP
jgi:C-terminal processing protease CtpA/Prc